MFTVNLTSATNFGIDAANVRTGQPVYIVYNTSNGFNPLITMGNNIREYTANGIAQGVQFVPPCSSTITQHFIGVGGSLLEVARTFVAPN
jgi:hypothetical protein